tara:strand:- start:1171 stop:1380 length:210 start_codon:yes stop_codon:yes gene_type:complete
MMAFGTHYQRIVSPMIVAIVVDRMDIALGIMLLWTGQQSHPHALIIAAMHLWVAVVIWKAIAIVSMAAE